MKDVSIKKTRTTTKSGFLDYSGWCSENQSRRTLDDPELINTRQRFDFYQ